jgi:hypothetical protein
LKKQIPMMTFQSFELPATSKWSNGGQPQADSRSSDREDVAALQRRYRLHRNKPSKIKDELNRSICGKSQIVLIDPDLGGHGLQDL